MVNKVNELIRKMNINEKIGQLSQNIFGWKSYEENGKKISSYFYDELSKYGNIGSIYGVLRSDPWSKVNYSTGVPLDDRFDLMQRISDESKGEHCIRPFLVEETPHGHQSLDATCLPVNLAIGCTFDNKLYEEACSYVAREIRMQGANIGLLSCLDLALDPRWGRVEECYGEDTFLAMQMTKSAIKGYQGNEWKIPEDKIGIVAKHMIGQGSSLGGHNGRSVSLGENELNTHHLPVLQEAIDNNVVGVMAAYNDIDGMPCHANEKLLIEKLRKQMDFKGFVMSDGCAIDNLTSITGSEEKAIALAIKSGVDVDLWNKSFNSLSNAISINEIEKKHIDASLKNVLEAKERLGLLDETNTKKLSTDFGCMKDINLKLSEKSIVLLKNVDNTLPLKNLNETCLIGPFADSIYHQLGDYTSFQDLDKVQNLKDVLNIPYEKGCHPRQKTNLLKDAISIAKNHKNVILNIGSSSAREFDTIFDSNGAAIIDKDKTSFMDCGEGMDVAEVRISDEQQKLFDAIYEVNKNIIVVITSGRPIGIEKISEKAKAVLQCFYGGQQTAHAIKNILLGKTTPTGKLSVSIPHCSAQLPVHYWQKETGKYVDMDNEPLFQFGHGLTYGQVSEKIVSFNKITNDEYEVTVELENSTNNNIEWPVLVFARFNRCSIKPPSQQLVHFERVELEKQLVKQVTFKINLKWINKNIKSNDVTFDVRVGEKNE